MRCIFYRFGNKNTQFHRIHYALQSARRVTDLFDQPQREINDHRIAHKRCVAEAKQNGSVSWWDVKLQERKLLC